MSLEFLFPVFVQNKSETIQRSRLEIWLFEELSKTLDEGLEVRWKNERISRRKIVEFRA